MEKVLSESGLDAKHWVEHFKDIGATTPATLKLLGPDHFDELSKFSEKPVETIALKKLLGVAKVSLIYMHYRLYGMISNLFKNYFVIPHHSIIVTHSIGHKLMLLHKSM